jgi:SpoVK/Ycf46/Vps4 family AAA+-type ATPase
MNYVINKKKEATAERFLQIVPEKTFATTVLSSNVLDELEDACAFCKKRDEIIEKWELQDFFGKGTIALNFWGPPGTGKSRTAEAFATELGMTLIVADFGELSGNLFGDTEKNLTELFEQAEKNKAIIFIDEADSLLSKRNSSNNAVGQTNNQVKSHLLTLLDRKKTIMVFATNKFEDYDRAFLRRIAFHINIDLPDENQRIKLWELHLPKKIPKSISYKKLSELSDKLSGGDIKNIALKLIIKLNSGKITNVEEENSTTEIERYKKTLENHQSNNFLTNLNV